MKLATVAPAVASAGHIASLLGFYRDTLDRLALFRLTERDRELVECSARVSEDLLQGCALLIRRARLNERLTGHEKIADLHTVVNRVNNHSTAEAR